MAKKTKKTSSLVDEYAAEYGVMEAILIQYFQYWIKENKKKGLCLKEGKWWTYGSTRKIASRFCYINEPKIKKILKSLRNQGIIIVSDVYNDRVKDRTLWYAFADEDKFLGED